MKKSMWLYNGLSSALKWILKPIFFTKTVGNENENVSGPVIYCANHISNWDAVIIACETKRPINFMAKKELFEVPVLKNLLSALGAFPIDRNGNDFATLKSTISALKDGSLVCLFPQGTRCAGKDVRKTEPKNGVALLAKHAKATVVPIGIYSKGYKIRPFKKVYVSIGKPIAFDEFVFNGTRDDYDRLSGEIFEKICDLCDEMKEKANAK